MIPLGREKYCERKVPWPIRQHNGSDRHLSVNADCLIRVKCANLTPTPPLATVMLSISQFRERCNLVVALLNHILVSNGSLSRDYLRHTFGKPLVLFVCFVIAEVSLLMIDLQVYVNTKLSIIFASYYIALLTKFTASTTSSFTLILKEISYVLPFLTYVPWYLCSLYRFFCLWWPDHVAIYCTAPATNHRGKFKGGNIYWTQTEGEIF